MPDISTDLAGPSTWIIRGVLWCRRASCLERSLVLQRWFAQYGRDFDVVVGVMNDDRFRAHAWLAGTEPRSEREFTEIMRVEAPALADRGGAP